MRTRSFSRSLLCAVAVAATVALASAGVASAGGAPPAIKKAGQLVVCSDIAYPAAEFYQGGKAVGFDVDIANAFTKAWHVKAVFANTGYDGIISALLSNKCDVIMSAMTITPERAKQISFVPYLKTGQTVMLAKSNPFPVKTLADLSGKAVAVTVGTTERDELTALNQQLASKGDKPVDIVTFQTDPPGAQALAQGKVDAYFADTTPVIFFTSKQPALFTTIGQTLFPGQFGIGVRKNDSGLRTAIQQAIARIYANGTMQKILAKWHAPYLSLKVK